MNEEDQPTARVGPVYQPFPVRVNLAHGNIVIDERYNLTLRQAEKLSSLLEQAIELLTRERKS